MEAGISFGWWFAGMMVAMLAGVALQFFFMARWIEAWERERGVRLFNELWPMPKRPLAAPLTRRSRYYAVRTDASAPPWAESAPDFASR